MYKRILKRATSLLLAALMVLSLLPETLPTFASAAPNGTFTVSDPSIGLSYTGSADSAWTGAGTTITGSAKSERGACGGTTNYNSTLTITNKKSNAAKLFFDYSVVVSDGSITVDGEAVSSKGSFSKEISANGSIQVTIRSGSTSANTSITLSNILLARDVEATTCFVPSANGMYKVNGTEVATPVTYTQNAEIAYSVSATAADGYKFFGWYDETNETYLSLASSAVLSIESDCTVTAHFIPVDQAMFETNGSYFADLSEAVARAQAGSKKVITLVSSGSVSGAYTIPSGITLLIPQDEAKSVYTSPRIIYDNTAPTLFRKLTLAENAALTVNGSIVVGGAFRACTTDAGAPGIIGPYGRIEMAPGSSITMESGANLYAWGFVTGSGTVLAKDGATVHEFFQVRDFRGGTATTGMGGNKSKVFIFNQYFIQNVEVSLTMNSGAKEIVYGGVYAGSTVSTTSFAFIGKTDAMFCLSSGSMTKDYEESTDRLLLTINGDASFESSSFRMGVNINTSSYVMPITNNMTIRVNTGTTVINQDAALLPGVELSIAAGASMKVASGKNLYVYDNDEWYGTTGGGGGYSYNGLGKAAFAPGRTYTRSLSDLVDVKIDVNGTLIAEGAIYTTAGGADICSSEGTGVYSQLGAPGTAEATYQATQNGTSISYPSIPITAAKLHNAVGDVKYTETATATAGTLIPYIDGIWDTDPITYTITFNANGGEGAMEPVTDYINRTVDLPANTFTREGYTFSGWNTLANGEGDAYAADASVVLTRDVTLYAHWSCSHATTEIRDARESTCSVKGYTGDTYCTVCGEKLASGTELDLIAHTPVEDAAVPATCSSTGLTAGAHCFVCGTTIVEQEVIEKLPHTEEAIPAVDSTCTETGLTAGTKCSVCGEVVVPQQTVEATGHTSVTDPAVAPTCTTAGKTEGAHCSVCDAVITAQAIVPATGHAIVTDAEVAATCTETGLTVGYHCSACGTVTKAQENVAALGHSWNEGEVEIEAGCTEAGNRKYTCTVCGETKTEAIEATGHTAVHVAEIPATCTAGGVAAGTKCALCSAELSGFAVIRAKGHSEVVDAAVTATCTATGLTEGKHCSVCNEVLLAQEVIPAKGHTEAVDAAVAPTCTATGLTEGKHCSACNEVLVEQTTVAALGHTVVVDAAVAPTCTTTGLTEGKHCSVCGEVFTAQEVIPAKGHTTVVDEAVVPTCTATGLTVGAHCALCGTILNAQEVIPATGHTESVLPAVAATCTKTGLTEGKSCSVCGEILVAQEVVPAKGHAPAEPVRENNVNPTCTVAGSYDTVEYCSVCGVELSRDKSEVPARGHDLQHFEAQAVTCTEGGWDAYDSCRYGDYTTCVPINALGHDIVTDAAVAATCTTTGLTEGKHCGRCDIVFTAQEVIPVIPHSYSEGEVTVAPTCTAEGVMTFTCTACGDSYTEPVAAVAHDYQNHICAICGEWDEHVKFYLGVTSGATVDAVVDDDYQVAIRLPADGVADLAGAKITAGMQNVASLGVDGKRVHSVEFSTGAAANDVQLTYWLADLYNFDTASFNITVDKTNKVFYTFTGSAAAKSARAVQDTIITGSANPAAARAAWQELASHITASTQAADDSYIVVANGSFIKLGNYVLCFESNGDLTINDISNPAAMSEAARAALKLISGEDTVNQLVVYAKAGSKLAVGQSVATLKEDYITTVTLTAEIVDSLEEMIPELQGISSMNDAILAALGLMQSAVEEAQRMGTIAIDFRPHTEHEYTAVTTKEATCTEAGEKTYTCSVCGHVLVVEVPAKEHNFDNHICTRCGEWDEHVKFYLGVTSGTTVDAVVDDGYQVAIRLPADGVADLAGAKITAGMQNVASLGVDGKRVHSVEFSTGSASNDVQLSYWLADLYNFRTVKFDVTVDKTNNVLYTFTGVKSDDGTVINGIADTAAARTAWQALASHVTASTQAADDSYITVANGSFIKLGSYILCFETNGDLTINDISNPAAMSDAARAALMLTTCRDTEDKLVVYAKAGSKLAVGQSVATLKEDYITTVTLTAEIVDSLEEMIPELQGISSMNDAILAALGLMQSAVAEAQKMGTIAIDFRPHTEADHEYKEEVTTEPTCTETGIKTYTCSICGDVYTEEIAALGHTEVIDEAVEATCTETGLTEGKHCSVCEAVLVAQEVVPAKGHTEDIDEAVAPTCTEAGKTEGKHCSVCNEILIAQETVVAIGHDYTISYTWVVTDDGVSCTADAVCANDETHTVTETAEITAEVTADPDIGVNGTTTYTATFENELFSTQTKSIDDIPALRATVQVYVTSGTEAGTATLTTVSGGGEVEKDAETTVTAKTVPGYTFVGWYTSEDGNVYEPIEGAVSLSYTFTPGENVYLKAVFREEQTPAANFNLVVCGTRYTVNGRPQRNVYRSEAAPSSEVTLSYTGSDEFLYWANANGKILSTSPTYTFTMVGPITIYEYTSETLDEDSAYVIFTNGKSQVLLSQTYTASEAIEFPAQPSQSGKVFVGWSMTEDEIHAAMASKDTIVVDPVFTSTGTYRVTTVYAFSDDGMEMEPTVSEDTLTGKYCAVTAPEIEGYTFGYWMLDGVIVSYTDTYKVAAVEDVEITAFYSTQAVEAMPITVITEVAPVMESGTMKLKITESFSLPEGYTNKASGILVATAANYGSDSVLILDNVDGENIRRGSAKTSALTNNNSYILNLKVAGPDAQVYLRSYLVVEKDGEMIYLYSDVIRTSYGELN